LKPTNNPQPGCQPCLECKPNNGKCVENCDKYYSPLALSLNGTDLIKSDKLVEFTLNPNEKNTKSKWIKFGKDQGFLAADFNKNGKIDDGGELFGEFTNFNSKHKKGKYHQYENAYLALADYADKNKDGVIKGKELVRLLLWTDENEDGISQANELHRIVGLGVVEINVGKSVIDQRVDFGGGIYGKPYSAEGVVTKIDGKKVVGKSWDIWLPSSLDKEVGMWEHITRFLKALVAGNNKKV
jgi:hypothetical protein